MDALRGLAATRGQSKCLLQLCKVASLDHEMKLAQFSRAQTKLASRQAPFFDGAAFGQMLHIGLERACERRVLNARLEVAPTVIDVHDNALHRALSRNTDITPAL